MRYHRGARAARSAAAAAVLGLAVVAAAPPAAAAAPQVQISSPTSNQTVRDSTPTIQGSAEMGGGVINDVSVTISSDSGDPVPPVYRVAGEDRSSVPFSWTPTLNHNGRYQVQARASGSDRPVDTNGPEAATATRSFAVEAPPSTPRGVKASVDESTRVVTVRWTANPEPDMVGYQVQRAVGDSNDWAVAGESKDTTFEDRRTSQNGGTYRYRVVAIREGATAGSGVTSNPSPAAEVTVPAGPPPSTAPNESGTGGGGDGGGTTTTVPGDSPDQGTGGSGGSSGGSSGGGTGGSGGSGGGTTGTTTARSGSTGPVITKSGRVDMSGFSLLDETRVPRAESTPAPDAGFSETLPFGADNPAVDGEGEGGLSAGEMPLDDADSDRRVMLTFLAAGLLATVLLMHVLWIKGEVDRPALEPLPAVRPHEPGRLKANRS